MRDSTRASARLRSSRASPLQCSLISSSWRVSLVRLCGRAGGRAGGAGKGFCVGVESWEVFLCGGREQLPQGRCGRRLPPVRSFSEELFSGLGVSRERRVLGG